MDEILLKNPEPPIPASLSELLALSIHATDELAKDANYIPDSGSWHQPKLDGLCHACSGGAVFRHVLCQEPAPTMIFTPSLCYSMSRPWRDALWALEALRSGRLCVAHELLFAKVVPSSLWSEVSDDEIKYVSWQGRYEWKRARDVLRLRKTALASLEAFG